MSRAPHPGLALFALLMCWACSNEGQASLRIGGEPGEVPKGGDDRTGPYELVEAFWKPAPDHDSIWTWGSVSGVAVDSPNRIIVAVWGDQGRSGQGERPNGSNYLLVVDRNGNVVENWSQWDSLFNRPHQVYISPYDPERPTASRSSRRTASSSRNGRTSGIRSRS